MCVCSITYTEKVMWKDSAYHTLGHGIEYSNRRQQRTPIAFLCFGRHFIYRCKPLVLYCFLAVGCWFSFLLPPPPTSLSLLFGGTLRALCPLSHSSFLLNAIVYNQWKCTVWNCLVYVWVLYSSGLLPCFVVVAVGYCMRLWYDLHVNFQHQFSAFSFSRHIGWESFFSLYTYDEAKDPFAHFVFATSISLNSIHCDGTFYGFSWIRTTRILWKFFLELFLVFVFFMHCFLLGIFFLSWSFSWTSIGHQINGEIKCIFCLHPPAGTFFSGIFLAFRGVFFLSRSFC